MLSSPPLFKNKKEFLLVAAVLISIILARLFFIYQDYKELKNLNRYYYTEAQIIKIFPNRGYKKDSNLLKLKDTKGLIFYIYTPNHSIKRYDWLRVKIKLKQNTSFFDYLRGFFAKGYIVEKLEPGFDAKAYVRYLIDKQHDLNSSINTFYHAIFLADPLDRELREKISNLGISHLVAISGFHLGILWILVFTILYIPYRFLQERYFPWRHRNIDLGFITLSILLLFVLFIGAPPAVTRSYIMILIGWLVLIFGLELISFQFLAFALLIILAVAPKLIASLGLLLSFFGVFYIFLLIKWLKNYSAWFITLIAIPVGIFLLMFPIGHFFFGNTTIWQLMSPPLSVAFIIFYPVAVILHLFGIGGVFDNALIALFKLPSDTIDIALPIPLIVLYIILSIAAIFNKKAFYLLLTSATIITAWAMVLYYLH